MYSLNCKGKLLSWKESHRDGHFKYYARFILCRQPDTFRRNANHAGRKNAGGRCFILDLGGLSSRPGANEISQMQKWNV